ncbi:amidohydrolase family protein [Allosphingosinicella indica]|uniref:Imidazolonepropionase n=1 Tax=Allosphingosinicella indica TaxID=941907 RepID=A0A1X7G0I9_9SPHN|nr:amidohydrolase family protein [Allosphingosinicella indica]SMF61864.1 Imidazolonepropionase [Allosphingosinicella indica]
MHRTLRATAALWIIAAFAQPALAHETPAAPAAVTTAAKPKLATPPATGATVWTISSPGGKHGTVTAWTDKDGTRWLRESMILRGFETDVEEKAMLAPDGTIRSLAIRGTTPSGDATEDFAIENGMMRFKSPVDSGEAAHKAGTFYAPYGGLAGPSLLLAEALLKAPNRTLTLAPSGQATLTPLVEKTVSHNGQSKTLIAYTLDGVSFSPFPIWFEGDKPFGIASFLNFLPAGWEPVAAQLSEAQDAALAARAPALMEKLAPRVSGPVVFENVRLYDADTRAFRDGVTVVAEGGKITFVGSAAAVQVPAGAKRIDGAGKTLVPGLWDSHMHYGDDLTGPMLLGTGITSVRDPGNKPEESIARKKRIDAGQLLGPRITPVMLIDGPGQYSAQMAVVASDPASALAAVRKAKDMGFTGIKLYGSLDKALVPAMTAEAKRLGLRIQGHLPHHMMPLEAVRAGYSELTHINMAMMQFMPEDVVANTNNLKRFYGPGRYAGEIDLNSPEVAAYIAELKKNGTVVDPTLAIFEGGYMPDQGAMSASYTPYAGILPPVVERGVKGGAFAVTEEVSRDQMRKSFAKMQAFTVQLYKAGVPIVAGTDGYGIELIRDLELYVDGGLTPGEALATATIIPAQVFGFEKERGSIAVGKISDLVLIDGDVSKDVGALRHVETVMLGDRLMNGAELRKAASIAGTPK